MKVKLVIIDEEERAKGRGFMKRVKQHWDMEYPEYQDASSQKLRDNAARFKKQKEVTNLILVRQREETHQNMDEQEVETEVEIPETQNNANKTGSNEEVVENLPEIVLDENHKELEQYFLAQLDEIDHCTSLNLEPRDKLPKVTLTDQFEINANKLLSIYLINADTIPEITDEVYAMGKAIGHKLGAGKKNKVEAGDRKQVGKTGGSINSIGK